MGWPSTTLWSPLGSRGIILRWRMLNTVRHLLIGDPLASSGAMLARLGVPLGFVIVAANALSSVAYASEEILIGLLPGGDAGFQYFILISLAVLVLMFLVVVTYDYVIRAYPGGGGAYVVAKENLGTAPGMVAGASLLVDGGWTGRVNY